MSAPKHPSEQKPRPSDKPSEFSEKPGKRHDAIDTHPPPHDKPKDDSQKKQIETKKHKLLFGIRRSVRYHNRRVLFYDHLHKTANTLSLLRKVCNGDCRVGEVGAFLDHLLCFGCCPFFRCRLGDRA